MWSQEAPLCSGHMDNNHRAVTHTPSCSCTFIHGKRDALLKSYHIEQFMEVSPCLEVVFFIGRGLGKTLTMPPHVMESTEKQCKVPLGREKYFLTFSSWYFLTVSQCRRKNEVEQKHLPRNKGSKKAWPVWEEILPFHLHAAAGGKFPASSKYDSLT